MRSGAGRHRLRLVRRGCLRRRSWRCIRRSARSTRLAIRRWRKALLQAATFGEIAASFAGALRARPLRPRHRRARTAEVGTRGQAGRRAGRRLRRQERTRAGRHAASTTAATTCRADCTPSSARDACSGRRSATSRICPGSTRASCRRRRPRLSAPAGDRLPAPRHQPRRQEMAGRRLDRDGAPAGRARHDAGHDLRPTTANAPWPRRSRRPCRKTVLVPKSPLGEIAAPDRAFARW